MIKKYDARFNLSLKAATSDALVVAVVLAGILVVGIWGGGPWGDLGGEPLGRRSWRQNRSDTADDPDAGADDSSLTLNP